MCMLEVLDSNFGWGFFFFFALSIIFSWRIPVLCFGNLSRRNLSQKSIELSITIPSLCSNLSKGSRRMFSFLFSCVCVAQQFKAGLGRLILEVYKSLIITHTHTHTHVIWLLWTSDHPVAEAATYTTQNKQKRRSLLSSSGFKPAIPAIKQLQTYAVDSTAAGISKFSWCVTFSLQSPAEYRGSSTQKTSSSSSQPFADLYLFNVWAG